MEDFQLLESLENLLVNSDTDEQVCVCAHEEMTHDKNMYVCLACGYSEKINDGQTYTTHKIYKRANKLNSISASLRQKGFDSDIIVTSNKIYNIVIDENTKRTGNRSSIICACVFQAFKIHGDPIDYANIYSKYNIQKKSALKGLKMVNIELAKRKDLSFHETVLTPILPQNFIITYMKELCATKIAIDDVLDIYAKIKTHDELDMSRPQSVAAGVIFYWLKKRGTPEAMKIIEEKAKLSQLTISKKAKIIALKIEELEAQFLLK